MRLRLVMLSVWLSGFSSEPVCLGLENCGACTSNPSCGWCQLNNRCFRVLDVRDTLMTSRLLTCGVVRTIAPSVIKAAMRVDSSLLGVMPRRVLPLVGLVDGAGMEELARPVIVWVRSSLEGCAMTGNLSTVVCRSHTIYQVDTLHRIEEPRPH